MARKELIGRSDRRPVLAGTAASILTFVAALGLIPGLASSHESSRPEQSDAEVTVFLARRCAMSDLTWRTAEKTATDLFRRIGVRLRFTTVRPDETDQRTINLLIVERAPKNLRPHVLGAATSDPTFGPVVFVFYDRLLEFYENVYAGDTGIVLGYAIAHEIGHVLRSEPGHSVAGIMKAYWSPKDASAMLRNSVRFSKADADRIHQMLTEQNPAKRPVISQD